MEEEIIIGFDAKIMVNDKLVYTKKYTINKYSDVIYEILKRNDIDIIHNIILDKKTVIVNITK